MAKKNQESGTQQASGPTKNKTAKKEPVKRTASKKTAAKKKVAKKTAAKKVASRKKPVKNKISAKEMTDIKDLKPENKIVDVDNETPVAATPAATEAEVADQNAVSDTPKTVPAVEITRKPQTPDQLLAATRSRKKRAFWPSLAMFLILLLAGAGFVRYSVMDNGSGEVAQLEDVKAADAKAADSAGFVDSASAFFSSSYHKVKDYFGLSQDGKEADAQPETGLASEESQESVFARLWSNIKDLLPRSTDENVQPDAAVATTQGEDKAFFASVVDRFKSWVGMNKNESPATEPFEPVVAEGQSVGKAPDVVSQEIEEGSSQAGVSVESGSETPSAPVVGMNNPSATATVANNPVYWPPVQADPAAPENTDTGVVYYNAYNPYSQPAYWGRPYGQAPYPAYYIPYAYPPYYSPQQGVTNVRQ
ncbi:MAG: hypothetical protein KDJ38_01045 [Gammaproteobacteria bacterium]|nr:hypothetical protein [Gammaproteobacteria bacterium]